MKRKNDEQGIEIKIPIIWKLLPIAFWILMVILFNLGNNPPNWFFWCFFIYLGLAALVGNPDFVLYEEGIEVKIWWLSTFVEWDNVRIAYYEKRFLHIKVKEVTPKNIIMKTFVNIGLGVPPNNKNYEFVAGILEERLGKRFLGKTSRKQREDFPCDTPE